MRANRVRNELTAAGLVAVLAGAGVTHSTTPGFYEPIVPRPAWPISTPMNSPAVAWLRLPLQAPLVMWALRVARAAALPGASTHP